MKKSLEEQLQIARKNGLKNGTLEEQAERMQKLNSEQIALHEKNKKEEDLNGSVSRC